MDIQKSIEVLQFFATNLNVQSFGHKIQGKVFGTLGLSKLAEKYAEHSVEEAGYVDQFIDRILYLGGEGKVEATQSQPIFTNPVDFLKFDLEVSIKGIEFLRAQMELVKDDITTFDILKVYLKDEEDMYWTQGQLQLIDCIGLQNWLVKQL